MGDDPTPANSSAPAAVSRFPPGTQFGRYRIVREIGTGGMGSVYEAVLIDLNKRVALKVLAAELTHQDEYRQRFVREARAAARIRHPNVVEIFDVGVHDGLPVLAMEYLVGNDMRARFDQGPMPVVELVDMIIPVIAAVVTAHDVKVIHRDLKPENIFLNQQQGQGLQPVVLDFGISKVLDEDASLNNLTATSSMMGTPLYMSPEQVRGSREVDPRTDQYALAVMLYEGLTAASAFTGNSVFDLLIKKTEGEFTPMRKHKADLPHALCAAIERAMAADRDARYASLRAFAQALLPFASDHVRAVWGSALSPSAEPDPPRATPTDGERSDSTLRSSVKEVPAYAATQRGFKAWHAGLALLAIGFAGFALARIAAPGKPRVNEGEHALRPAAAAAEPQTAEAKPLPSVFTLRVTGTPAAAQFTLDGEAAGSGTLVRQLPKDGKAHVLELSASGYESKRVTFTDADAPSEVVLQALPVVGEPKGEPAAVRPAAAVVQEPKGDKRANASSKRAPKPATSTATTPATPRPALTGSNDSPVLY